MDRQQFLAKFGHIANAPNGIPALRQMIYQLAVTGSLTPRGEGLEDSRALLANIEATRNKLIREKKYKRMLELESEAVAIPERVEIPSSWCWTRLLDVGEINPRNHATDEEIVAFLPMSGVPQSHGATVAVEPAKWGEVKKGFTHFANGDVVLAKITPCFENGKATAISDLPVTSGIGAGTTELHVFRPIHSGILPAYIYLFLRSPLFAIEGERNMTGTAGQKRLPTNYFATRALPLPPLEEQVRIVAKVDELMALCETLEAKQQNQQKLQNGLRQATLQAVATAASPFELQSAWARLADNLGRLMHSADSVRAIRDVVLDLAMRGVFLPTTTLNATTSDEERPLLPEGWEWKALGELAEYITSGSRGWKGYISTSGDAFIRSQDIKSDALVFENPAFVSLPEKAEGKRTLVREGDLLLTITGGNVGKCAFVPALKYNAYVSQHVALIRLYDSSLAEFIHFWMVNVYGGRNFLSRYIYGDKPGLNLAQVASVQIPLPPQTARARILVSLRQYQMIFRRLAQQAESKFRLAEALAKAAVANITGTTSEQVEDEPLKAPQTELIAQLRLGEVPDTKALAPLATILARYKGELSAKDLWQRFGGQIDEFYAQLKAEVAQGWILAPAVAEMRERPSDKKTS